LNRRRGASYRARRGLSHIALICYSAFAVTPLIFTLFASFKTVSGFFANPFSVPWPLVWSNYSNAWSQADLLSAFINSLVVAAASIAVSTVVSAWAAYAIVRLRIRASAPLQVLLVIGLLVPAPVLIIPLFILMRWMHVVGTIGALIIPYVGLLIPLAFLIYVNFMRQVPQTLGEAAWVDGCGHWRTFWKIEFPLLRPATQTVIMLNAVFVWNDFLIPLVFGVKQSLYTLPVAVVNFYGEYQAQYGLVFASVVMSALPIVLLYILFSRRFIEGLTAGALK
jgi:raffinose/stachyose/melibiose transport system permease protein